MRLDVCPFTAKEPAKVTWQRQDNAMIKGNYLATAILAVPLAFAGAASAQTAAKKPNIIMIMADDVGISNGSRTEPAAAANSELRWMRLRVNACFRTRLPDGCGSCDQSPSSAEWLIEVLPVKTH